MIHKKKNCPIMLDVKSIKGTLFLEIGKDTTPSSILQFSFKTTRSNMFITFEKFMLKIIFSHW